MLTHWSIAIPPDNELLAAIATGDDSAMGLLYDRYSPLVYSVALRALKDEQKAEDVLQEVFMQIWRNSSAPDGHSTLAAWLAVRTRECAMQRRQRPETKAEGALLSSEGGPASTADPACLRARIRLAMGSMSSMQRTVLEMAYFEGRTHGEIASRTGEAPHAVKTHIRSGLLALREALAQ